MRIFALGLTLLVLAPACSQNPDTVTTPQAKVAHYAADVLEAVRSGQETVIALNKTDPSVMTTERTRDILDRIKQLAAAGEKLRDVLVAYDTATTLDFRTQKAAEIKTLLDTINTLASTAFKQEGLPDSTIQQLAQFAVNIVTLTNTIKAEVEKLR
jgi:gamma-glutamyl:cysteine ligase YbdK (ATP-grasp superfamily)